MKNEKLKNDAWRGTRFFLIFHFSFFISFCRADDFGDISASANAMYSGNTFHGYAETRVTLENRSSVKTHSVTLISPNNSYGAYGNAIGRISRAVKLAPGARAVVPLLQPPLPANGDGQIRVDVDGHNDGNLIHAPNANNHCNYYSRGGQSATVFISRNLDFDATEKILNANHGAFTAEMATGAPDAGGGRGYQPTAWMPDTRRYGLTNWLELDYATPQPVDKIQIYETRFSPSSSGEISLIGTSGTNIVRIPMSSGRTSGTGSRGEIIMDFSFPLTSDPVKTVRLNFGKTPPNSIAIDAVEISGPSGTQWASAARASSDNSASAIAFAPGSANAVESLRAEMPASEWSEDWLAYTPFDAIALDAADLGSMSPAVLDAIENYLQAGGIVFLFGQNHLPESWHSAQKTDAGGGLEYEIGFGHCFVFPTETVSSLDSKTVQNLRNTVRDAAHYWQSLPQDSASANAAFPVVENLKIPARGIVIVMLAFIIAIGPANIIFLSRRNRRTWMLWTIPAISFATTLVVFAYSLLREGVAPTTRIAGVTVLDQTSHRAATVGVTAFYCPLTPSGGLHFDFETEATPLVHSGYDRSGNSREVDWTQTQNFRRGWVSARVPAHFHLRKSETRRERLQLENENGQLKIINGLGAPITALWLADANGNIYRAYNVAAGQKISLIPVTGTPVYETDGHKVSVIPPRGSHVTEQLGAGQFFKDIGFAAQQDNLTYSAEKYLLPNSYIAELDGNPFIENALGAAASPKHTRINGIVFGIFETTDEHR
ncbi:MAG: hypothetical protein ACREFE_08105 [Limisphaerales bacterium]